MKMFGGPARMFPMGPAVALDGPVQYNSLLQTTDKRTDE